MLSSSRSSASSIEDSALGTLQPDILQDLVDTLLISPPQSHRVPVGFLGAAGAFTQPEAGWHPDILQDLVFTNFLSSPHWQQAPSVLISSSCSASMLSSPRSSASRREDG